MPGEHPSSSGDNVSGGRPERVVLCECFVRDGLQHEEHFIATEDKVRALELIAACGFQRIEITALSHPKYVPQFADADQVLQEVPARDGVLFKATCPNPASVRRALAARDGGFGPSEISFLVSASEGHTRKNLRRSREEQWENVAEMARLGTGSFSLVGTISVSFDCPFDGRTPLDTVLQDAARFHALGVDRIAIGDTVGSATPPRVAELMTRLRDQLPDATFIAHFHDSRGTGLANYVSAFGAGIRFFDTSLGGTGGHPARIAYGEGFTGNVCTEDFVTLLEAMGVDTGIDVLALRAAGLAAEAVLGRRLHSRTLRMGEALHVA